MAVLRLWPYVGGMSSSPRVLAVCLFLVAVRAPLAEAATFGSSLRRPANTNWGCEAAPVYDPFSGGATLQPTGVTTCTLWSAGRIGSSRNWSSAPADGRVTRIRVRSGRNPAPLRLTILEASTRANPDGGGGDFLCCTGGFQGRVFRPRPNAVTTRRVNARVTRDRDGNTTYYDIVGLSAMGPGTLPLHDTGTGGQLVQGSPLSVFNYPHIRRGETRVDNHSADGLEILFRWRFERAE